MKKCPFCAEEIQDAAIKCRYCGEFLDGTTRPAADKKTPWYFKTSYIIISFCCIGPLALPLVWFKPNLSRTWKIVITVIVLATSWILYEMTVKLVASVERDINQIMNQYM